MLVSDFSPLDHLACIWPEEIDDALCQHFTIMIGIDHAQMRCETLQQMGHGSAIIHDMDCRSKKQLDPDGIIGALLCSA